MSRGRLAWIALGIACAGGLFALTYGSHHTGALPGPNAAESAAATARPSARGAKRAALRASAASAAAQAPSQPGAEGTMTLHAGAVVSHVNGHAVRGSDLAPFKDPSQEITMSRERYAFLLDRALEREVVLQAARSAGITLTNDQKQQVADSLHGADDPIGAGDAASFDRREMRAQILLNELAARAGAGSPFATEAEVTAYQEKHAAELGPLPEDAEGRAAALARIRERLALEKQKAHADFVRELVDQLWEDATII